MNEQIEKKNIKLEIGRHPIYFYRATGEYGFLSNLFPAPIEFEGQTFPTAEHAYQYGKFAYKKDADWAMTAPNAHFVAILAHGLFAWDIVPNWAKIKVNRMRMVVDAKFKQHLDLAQQLIATNKAILIEESNMDSFWGMGKDHRGKNMLGRILMETREKLHLINERETKNE